MLALWRTRNTRERPRLQSPTAEARCITAGPTIPPDRYVTVDEEQVRTQLAAVGLPPGTPKSRKRGELRSRKLFDEGSIKPADVPLLPWSQRELEALVTFLILYSNYNYYKCPYIIFAGA